MYSLIHFRSMEMKETTLTIRGKCQKYRLDNFGGRPRFEWTDRVKDFASQVCNEMQLVKDTMGWRELMRV